MERIRDRVSIEFQSEIAIVGLSRADKYNGLDFDMMHALVEAADQVRRQPDIRAVILHGEGNRARLVARSSVYPWQA